MFVRKTMVVECRQDEVTKVVLGSLNSLRLTRSVETQIYRRGLHTSAWKQTGEPEPHVKSIIRAARSAKQWTCVVFRPIVLW